MSAGPTPAEQLASLSSAVLLLGPGLEIRGANPAAEHLIGMGAKRLLGRKLSEVAEFRESRFSEMLDGADAQISALSVKTRFGSHNEHKLDLILSPVIDHPGWQMLAMHDIGATESLGEGDEPPLRAPAILAHEIKNPLAAIRGAAQLLGRKLKAPDKDLTSLITDEVDRIAKLVDRMQSLGREQPEPVSPCNLHEVIRRSISVIEAADSNVRLSEEFDPSLPAVLGNEDALVQVFINLLSNARDACAGIAEPRIMIRTRFVSGLALTALRLGRPVKLPIEVRVSDNGPGVDAALRDHIFEPFVSSKKNGQGLGLALVNKLVRDMDGRISHERDESAGITHFRVHLPMAR